ncbi:acyl-[acyl-carrier-protein]--UDP-N-acetylglucosamine O-acyltransferase [Marivirga lumbricoides]|uniref:Acyl-[acyl-carrier-protein]--UDP-N-acetylglucosamine O-acyltransferase n=1 Tax=Marivirga lumbricoides TaxID=1046115 RepID=A0A2T4DUV8_9BACT|nr:acyl-[acyl-carrier-protein]--UDP-N-acetylglucosamine O-acyltransferase [Marivirga lumbricoides]GGC20942.1 acyl-[acyl-carrier-protein]--UDP-N-acetylglucosamine O-acyltransferase [Marivirga lumbricoides]
MGNSLNYIHPEAKIGKNVVIEPFAFIDKNVVIGDNTWIGPNAVINSGARIGNNCKIFSGATIAAIPQDLKFAGEETLTEIGDNTVIREYVNISRGTVDKKTTKIGTNCLIMAFVHIAHDCIIGNHCIIVNSVQLGGHVTIDDWAIIGGASAVHQFVKVGSHVMISGGSLVRKDVPPYVKAAREPLTYCGINSVGLRRRGFTNERINDIQEIYRNLYLSGLNNAKALEKIETLIPSSEERDNITSFVRKSERGIMKGYSN